MTRAPRNRRPLLAGTAVAVLALVAACGSAQDTADDPTTAATSPAVTPSPTPTSPAPTASAGDEEADAAAPAFPADTAVDTGEPSADAALTVTDVRVGHHEGFDRVVLELDGNGTPGWRVEYVDAAVEDPSDAVVDITGDSVLQIMVTGTQLPYETGLSEFATRQPVTAAGTTAVTEAVFLGTFEAQSQALVGVAGEPVPFRAYLLADPVRLVVDVQG
jgi:hypothetical protein